MPEIPSELNLQKILADYLIDQLLTQGHLEDELCEISQRLALKVVNPKNTDMVYEVAGEINLRLSSLLTSAYATQLKGQ